MKKPFCLVTGGAGFIGSHLVENLLREGFRVRVLDNLSTGKKANLAAFLSQIDWVRGDLRKEADVRRAVKGIDYVFHAAASRAVVRSVEAPLETHDVNVTGTLRLLLAARDAGVKRLIFSSSCSVYGDTQKLPCRENDLVSPESPYGASKLMGEHYCRMISSLYGLETVSLRYFNVYGPRQHPESRYSMVIPIFIQRLMQGKRPEVHWDGKQSRDFVYVGDVVKANLLAMKKPNISGEVFNIASREEYSVLGVLDQIRKNLPVKAKPPVFGPKRPGDVRRTSADIQKAGKMLGYRPGTPFKEGLRKTVAWFLNGQWQRKRS